MLALALLLMRTDPPVEQSRTEPAETLQQDAPQEAAIESPAANDEKAIVVAPDCPDYSGPNDLRKSFGDIRNELESAVVSLQGSGQPEHWLAAAILLAADDTQTTMNLLQRLLSVESTAGLAAFQLLRLCDERNKTLCESAEIQDAIIRADGDNGVMWIQIASLRLDAGREQGAIDALRRAINAPRFDNYFSAQIDVLDRGLSAVTGWSYTERVVHAAEAMSSNPFSLSGIRGFCQLSETAGWSEVCDAVGERVIAEGGDISTRLQGAELRLALEENRQSPQLIASIESERDSLKAMQSATFSDESHLNLLLNDESVMRAFVEVYRSNGEEGAMLELETRAAQLRASPNYDQCNFVSNPFIRLSPLD